MNRPLNFNLNTTPFQHLSRALRSSFTTPPPHHHHRRVPSLDEADVDDSPYRSSSTPHNMSTTAAADTPRQSISIPLINLSRSPSPYARSSTRNSSARGSEEEQAGERFNDNVYEGDDGYREGLLGAGAGARQKRVTEMGGLGEWLFESWAGWQTWVGVLVVWCVGCGYGLVMINRFILLTGLYKFPYPLTATFLQLVVTHFFLVLSAFLTRLLRWPLTWLGLEGAVAPATPAPTGPRAWGKDKPLGRLTGFFGAGRGGIAGGDIFEFQWSVAKQFLPLAVLYLGKVLLSNLSFAYAPFQTFTVARIGVVPLTLIFTTVLTNASHSVSVLSAVLTATINLLIAAYHPSGVRVTWESIITGIFSSIFAALYPILLLRAYRQTLSNLTTSDHAEPSPYPKETSPSGDENTARAFWTTLHYTSLLTILLLFPFVILSSEVPHIARNCYFLDIPFFWFLTVSGGLGAWAVFTGTLLLAKATSPLTVNFVHVPRTAFLLVALEWFRADTRTWVGVGICAAAVGWYVILARQGGARRFAR